MIASQQNNSMDNNNIHNNIPDLHKQPVYINGVGWRYETEHRMTRWPEWKDSRLPGTYMFTLNVNGGQHLLGHLEGTARVVYAWMKDNSDATVAASRDALYYRHALLGTRPMPFVKPAAPQTTAVETAVNQPPLATPVPSSAACTHTATPVPSSAPVQGRFYGPALSASQAQPAAAPRHAKTHFPLEALQQPDAPHIVLSPLGEKVLEAWNRMPKVVPEIEHICLAIMPNHIHAVIALHREISRPIGAVIRSFMGVTTHSLHQMMSEHQVLWNASAATIGRKASPDKPSLWEERFCVGVCQSEDKLHTRIGYVLENPFFGILEKEHRNMMQRVQRLTIAGRKYRGYGNMLLLKEPDRIQVFCHRKHPVTKEPYHLTSDFLSEKSNILRAAAEGVVIVTPGISPGESDIMWSVLRAGGNVINIQKEELTDRWHPDNERRLYCSRGTLLVLAVHDMPHQVFRDHYGQIIPTDSKYVKFHLLNLVAAELCSDGIEHSCYISSHAPLS